MHLSGIVKQLQENNQSFVCYRLPDASEPVLLLEGEFEELSSANEALARDGFIINPFEVANTEPVLFFSPGVTLKGWQHPEQILKFLKCPENNSTSQDVPPVIDFTTYSYQAEKLISILQSGELKKVVLSRVIELQLDHEFNPGSFFVDLCERYPSAFVFAFNYCKGKSWIGATPELLLQVENSSGKTMSMAATQANRDNKEFSFSWPDKEKLEQGLVTDYILNTLRSNGIENIIESSVDTIVAGPVVHLRKTFNFQIPPEITSLKLAESLHPTPAVCGLPLKEARRIIRETETHKRSYYSGFLGPVSAKGDMNLFVNLRCMQLVKGNAYLYVGGGLLAASDIKQEWNETIKKAETLQCMLQK